MGDILQFKSKQPVQAPATFWQNYKTMLRKYYDQGQVERIVAAILDMEIYNTTEDWVRDAADLYYKHAPDKK